MRTFGFSIRPVMDGGATITQKEVEISRETAGRVFPDFESANEAARVVLQYPAVNHIRIERVSLSESLILAEAVRNTVQ